MTSVFSHFVYFILDLYISFFNLDSIGIASNAKLLEQASEMATVKYRHKHFSFWFLVFVFVFPPSKAFYAGIHPDCQRNLETNLSEADSLASSVLLLEPGTYSEFHQAEMHQIDYTENISQNSKESPHHQEACLFRMKGLLCFTSWTAELFYARPRLHDEDSRMQPVHDTFAHMGIVIRKKEDTWSNISESPALEDGLNTTDANEVNNEQPATSLSTHVSALIRMEGSNKTSGMAAPPPEIVRTETPVISTSVRIEVNNVSATSVDLGIGDASARQDSMSIARKAHEETTARQDSMSIADNKPRRCNCDTGLNVQCGNCK